MAIYDRIGRSYTQTRRPDPRIARQVLAAVGDAGSLVNVGAGTGSYEPGNRRVLAVEPSATMVRQRPPGSAPVVRGCAEALPLRDCAVDCALAVLTMHHWRDPRCGLDELRRVARARVVVLTWDQPVFEGFWLIGEYFPCIRGIDGPRAIATGEIAEALGESRVEPVPVPHDCVDGFLGAFWRRPEAYLDPRVRAGISVFPPMSPGDLEDGLARLARDLESGAWSERHRDLQGLEALDLGYRLVVGPGAGGG